MIKKIRKLLKCKKGLTLLEVIVASTVACIVLMCALGFVTPLINSIVTNKNIADAKTVSSSIIFQIQRKVMYSGGAEIKETPSYADTDKQAIYQFKNTDDVIQTMYTPTGQIADAKDLIGKEFYGKKLDYKVYYSQAEIVSGGSTVKKPALNVRVMVYKKGTSVLVYDVTDTVVLLNAGGGSITDNTANKDPGSDFDYILF